MGDDLAVTPQQLIQAANKASDLSSLRPYRLEGSIIVNRGKGNEKMGTLAILQDKDRSRMEISFGNYREVKVVVGNKLYLERNVTVRPLGWQNLPDLQRLWRLTLAASDQVSAVSAMQAQGKQANCFDVTMEEHRIERECFDTSSQAWIESGIRRGDEKKVTPFSGTQFLDYTSRDGKQFPRTIRETRLGKTMSEIINIEIKPAQFQDSDFAIPAKVTPFETCEEMAPARRIESQDPKYPPVARTAHIQGDVIIRAVIGKNGQFETLQVISGHPILVQAAVDAVKRWRYSPAMCPAGPVAIQRDLTIRFVM